MFTIKTIINNMVAMHEVETPLIALPDTEVWDQVMEWMVECNNREHDYLKSLPLDESLGKACYAKTGDWKDLGGYDFLEYHPPFFADAAGTTEQFPEEMIESRRPKVWLHQCTGILILEAKHPERGALNDCEFTRGAFYQFLYPGDTVFVMNSAGATVHTHR